MYKDLCGRWGGGGGGREKLGLLKWEVPQAPKVMFHWINNLLLLTLLRK